MRETEFITQNKDKWRDFERILNEQGADPDELGKVFIETTDDLSFARTRYRNRSVRVYLNGLAQRIYQHIYKRQRNHRKNALWSRKIPSMAYHSRYEMLISLLVFLLAIGIGLLSSSYHPDFVSIILGDEYVAMSEANVESGDPMAVYKDMEAVPMFLYIAWNNIRVSFLVFVMGVFFSIGTIMALLRNGVMVGAFLYFFIERGLFRESFLAIMLHGTLELLCIVLAGAAGLTLGRGLLFPGSYTRMQAFLLSARKGITLMVAITPLLILAALIESFATRYTETPDILRILIILLSFGLMAGYFVWVPFRLAKAGLAELQEDELPLSRTQQPVADEVKSSGRIFTESFFFLSKAVPTLAWIALFLGLIHLLSLGFAIHWSYSTHIDSDYFRTGSNLFDQIANLLWFPDDISILFQPRLSPIMIMSLVFAFGGINFFALRLLKKYLDAEHGRAGRMGIAVFILTAIPVLGLLLPSSPAVLLIALLFPLLNFIMVAYALHKKENKPLTEALALLSRSWLNVFGVTAIMGSFQFVCMFLVNAPVSYFIFDFVLANLSSQWAIAVEAPFFLYGLLAMTALLFLHFFQIIAIGLAYCSAREVSSASGLMRQLATLGTRKRSYGVEREE